MRPSSAGAFAVAVVLGLTGCGLGWVGGQQVPGCEPPPNEDALLDEYANDPVMAVVPDGAEQIGEVARLRGCREFMGGVSNTAFRMRWRLSQEYDERALRRIYEPVAVSTGWHADPGSAPGESTLGEVYLTYCRTDDEVTSRLVVHAYSSRPIPDRTGISARPSPLSGGVDAPDRLGVQIYADLIDPDCAVD